MFMLNMFKSEVGKYFLNVQITKRVMELFGLVDSFETQDFLL